MQQVCAECGAAFCEATAKENLRFCKTTRTYMCAECYDGAVECDVCGKEMNLDEAEHKAVRCGECETLYCLDCLKSMARELGLKATSGKIDAYVRFCAAHEQTECLRCFMGKQKQETPSQA